MSDETPSVETAYNEAKAGFELGDISLYPYSFARKAAADAMGIRWGYVPEDDPMIKTGKYSGALGDAVKVLWLCTIPNASEQTAEQVRAKEWSVQRAERKPEEAYAVAQQWAEGIGIASNDSEEFVKAYNVFLKIMSGERITQFRVTTDSPSPIHEEEPDPNANAPLTGPNEQVV